MAPTEALTRTLRHIHDPLNAIENSTGGANRLFLRTLRRRARKDSLPVYLVGGPLRDALLGVPVKDLDFVLEGDAPTLARSMAEELNGEVVVHRRFGTATVALEDSRIDVVTARRETYPQPGALPEVVSGTIEDDLARRDFSINALAIPLSAPDPQILDSQDGLDDLSAGLVRVLHPRSFVDDPTRILRAVRYEQRFGFALEGLTRERLRAALSEGYVGAVSGDRLRHELERMLEEENPLLPLQRAADLGVLKAIHPALHDSADLTRLEAPTSQATVAHYQAGPLVYLAALVYRLSPPDGEGVIQRLKMPGSWAEVVRDTIELRLRESRLAAQSLAPSQICGLVEGLADPAVSAVARLTGSQLVARRLERFLNEYALVRPRLRGDDLLEMGVPRGPMVGEILARLREAKLDRGVSSEADERRIVREILGEQGGP